MKDVYFDYSKAGRYVSDTEMTNMKSVTKNILEKRAFIKTNSFRINNKIFSDTCYE